jgi:hypothetical protein
MLNTALSALKGIKRNSCLVIHFQICNTYLRRTADKVFDFLIGRKHSRKGRQVELVFRELKAQIYWPTTDQKVRGSNPCGRTLLININS